MTQPPENQPGPFDRSASPQSPGPQQYPAQGYPQQYPAPSAPSSGKAIAILVLGIVGVVFACSYGIGVIPAIVGLALAPGAKREIALAQGRLGGQGFIQAGVICAWIAVGIAALWLVAGLFAIVAVIASS